MANPTFFMYSVHWYDEYKNEHVDTKGLLVADSFAKAASNVEAAFDYIETITIESINDDDMLDLEDLLLHLNPQADRESALGPQLIAALEEAIEMTDSSSEKIS